MDISNVLCMLVMREKKRTHHSEGLMAEYGEPLSWYNDLQATGRLQVSAKKSGSVAYW